MNMQRRVSAAAALWLLLSPTAFAQRAMGVVRDSATAGVLSSAVVSALDSAHRTLARTISGDAGRYTMELPANATHLRIVRLGFQPHTVILSHERGPVLVLDVAMQRVATLLTTTVVNDNRLCSSDIDRTGALSLWEQARAGLMSTVVARDALPAQASIMSYQRVIDDGSRRVIRQTQAVATGRTTRPFLAGEPPFALATFGYIDVGSAGEQIFRAPDADVLLDDTFAATHCFNVKQGLDSHAGLIGLAFEPVRGRDKVVDVAGTLWMEASVPALHSIEFLYTDGENAFKKVNAGGLLAFRTMPNGVSFIKDWVIRLPVIDTSSRTMAARENQVGTFGQRRIPFQTSEAGGVVLTAQWADSSRWVSSLMPFTGHVFEQNTSTPLHDMRVVFEAFPDTLVSDRQGRVSLFPMLPGRYRAAAIDTTLATFIDPRISQSEFEVFPDSSADVRFELPGPIDLVRAVCAGTDALPRTSTIFGRIGDGHSPVPLPRNVSIMASWKTGRVFVPTDSRAAVVDAEGRFTVCAVPSVESVTLTASRFGYDFADIVVPVKKGVLLQELDWALDIGAITRLAGQKLASVSGRITDEGSGSPIVGAEVWIPTVDRHATTDSLGLFRVDSIPAGPALLQVRSLGYGVKRDRVLLAAGQIRRRDFVLGRESTVLAGVTVNAASLKGTSSGYRYFEERRLRKTSGYFVSDSLLRAVGDRPLSSILLSRMGGATLVPGASGQMHLVSSTRSCQGPMNSCRMPTCYVSVFMDGRPIYPLALGDGPGQQDTKPAAGLTNTEVPPDINFFQTASLSGVEFYPSSQPVPPEFARRNSQCGTLLLWTRER
ncbi:MAG: hypothetical protein JWM95_2201 [Gemmatimonadetes bacterium]|nr:hypothetical protein [Gemmatimonadota bacterium]